MSQTRLAVVAVLFAASAVLAGLGFTDGKLTELKPVAPVPAIVGSIIALTGRRLSPRAPFAPGDWSGPHRQALHALGTGHGFTPEHLEANRAGRLHPQQQAEGLALGRTDVRFGAVMLSFGQLALLAGVALGFFPRAIKDVDFTFHVPEHFGVAVGVGLFLGGLVGAVPLVLGWVAFRHGRRMVEAHQRGVVAAVEGRLEKLEVRRSRSGSAYYFVIDGVRLGVNPQAWETTPGGRYRAYHVPGTTRLLSLEPS